ncbi:MAG TPA: hypothetical protein P5294_01065 [Smithellaceae bacterium]|nr:hypothetical protein [Smithellaceae bacterium]HRS89029.1 hypothetical protein [Smithellaceae bacterium]HRV25099.1 hypothetical protein [Smithellaceae bacterium]
MKLKKLRKFLKFIFSRPNIIFLCALLAGFIIPQASAITIFLILPALMTIMTITPLKIPRGFFRRVRPLINPALKGNLMNYILLGNVIIFAGIFFFIQEIAFWFGLVLVAAVPPAVGILALGKNLKADSTIVFAGFAGAHLGALLVIPLIGLGFLKYTELNYWLILVIVIALIVLPLVVSRVIVEREWDKKIETHAGVIIDACFFIVFYTITAKIRPFVIDWTLDMTKITFIAALSVFLIFFIFCKIARLTNAAESKTSAWLLLATMKNYGLAGGLALLVFSPEAAFAALAFAVVNFIYTNWLNYKKVFQGKNISAQDTPPS